MVPFIEKEENNDEPSTTCHFKSRRYTSPILVLDKGRSLIDLSTFYAGKHIGLYSFGIRYKS